MATREKARFHKAKRKKSGACPEKNLGGCYPIFFQVHALKNLRCHPQNHFSGCRSNGCKIKNFDPKMIVKIVLGKVFLKSLCAGDMYEIRKNSLLHGEISKLFLLLGQK